ncbi:hypothetical protein ACFQ88_07850 [Paenibacillus sp. NPDC056579]|uniref:hypothetical protein n=1 Tax=unclassified Paenibacillus TaxID=185978 RepID=UPI001EF9ABD1|nr:hypothetical protein [Paenibacillus sp. H1-7]
MKNKFEIDSACLILGLQLELALKHLEERQIEYRQLDNKYYTDENGLEELEKLKHTNG